jgi:hypothetical protein
MGDGTFRPVVKYDDSSDPIWIEAGDFTHDGKLDLVTANDQGNALHVFLGNGDGTFSPFKSFAAGTRTDSVAVGDFNGDGFLDLAATNEFTNNVWVLLNAAEGPAGPRAERLGFRPSEAGIASTSGMEFPMIRPNSVASTTLAEGNSPPEVALPSLGMETDVSFASPGEVDNHQQGLLGGMAYRRGRSPGHWSGLVSARTTSKDEANVILSWL